MTKIIMEIDIQGTVVFEKNWDAINSNKRFIRNEGGSRSSKTYSLCQVLILYCLQNPDKLVSIIRKTFPALRASVMRDMLEVMRDMDIYNKDRHSKTEHIYTFENGSQIEFFSADDEQKLRGRKRDIAWCNEANELTYDDWTQINMRTTEKIIVDYNPSEGNSFLYTLDLNKVIDIHSTYHDNPFLSKDQKEEIEDLKRTDDDMYQIFALGKRCFSKQNVFRKWEVVTKKPEYLVDFLYGIDFGHSHPTALIKIWYCTDRKELYLEELIYESNLTSDDIVKLMDSLGVDKTKPVVADYARPEIIHDIKRGGYQCVNAIKDVKDGLNAVKLFKTYVSHTSSNIIKENENYKYKKINGIVTDEVIKLWDDAADAIRYGVMYIKKHYWKGDDKIGVYKFNF